MLILDVVGPIAHQAAQTNYHTALTCGIQFVRTDWCVRGATASKIIIQWFITFMDKYFSQIVLSAHERRNM